MLKSLRRWWAGYNHRHEYTVILRFTNITHRVWAHNGKRARTDKSPAVLERCTCGHERARYYHNGEWWPLDVDFVSDQLARKKIDVPARHQE